MLFFLLWPSVLSRRNIVIDFVSFDFYIGLLFRDTPESFLLACYADYLKSIHHDNIDTVQFENAALNPALSTLELMYVLRKHYKEIGM
jgi:hypothetical protein